MFRHTAPTEGEQMDETFLTCVEHTYCLSIRLSDTGVAMEPTTNTVNAYTRSTLENSKEHIEALFNLC